MKPKKQMSGIERGVSQLIRDAKRNCESAFFGLGEYVRLVAKWKIETDTSGAFESIALLEKAIRLIGDV